MNDPLFGMENPPLVCDSKGKAVWKGLAYYDADYDGARALTQAGLLHKAAAADQCQGRGVTGAAAAQCQGRGVTGVAAAQCRRESHRRSVRARDVTPERQPASARKPGVNSKC